MPIKYDVGPDGILLIERSGAPDNLEEDASMLLRLADDRIVPGMRVLVDSRKVIPADSCEVVKHLAAVARATAVRLDCGALALVVSSDVAYGMARMYMALTEREHPNTQVFRDYAEALSWLQTHPLAPAGPAPSGQANEAST
jgi:hypothetical protein